MLRENRLQGLVDECRLTTATDTCNDDEFAKWEFCIDMLQVVTCATMKDKRLTVARSPFCRNGYLLLSVQILSCDGVRLEHLLRCTLEDDLATLATSTRSNVYDVVGIEHHVLIVFYDNNGIAQVAQFFQRTDQSFVIALMKSDGGLIQDVKYIDELRTNLRSQTDALALTTRETGRLTVKSEIIESHF